MTSKELVAEHVEGKHDGRSSYPSACLLCEEAREWKEKEALGPRRASEYVRIFQIVEEYKKEEGGVV